MDNYSYIILRPMNCPPPLEAKYLGHRLFLDQAQQIVGGQIEVIPVKYEHILIVDEEGLTKELFLNHFASTIANTIIVGTAIYCKQSSFM